ncbi:tRNA methyltransferase 10 homolog B-like [Glandiceps talaboti]
METELHDPSANINEIVCSDDLNAECPMSKKGLKRQMRYQAMVQAKKAHRKEKKDKRKARMREEKDKEREKQGDDSTDEESDKHNSKKYNNRKIKTKLEDAMKDGQRICIDCGFEKNMDAKEICRLAQQLGRLYGANRHAEKPFHIYFTNLDKEGAVYKECVRVNCGFENYLIDKTDESHLKVFKKDEIVYLSPDSKTVLECLQPDKVYVIGGLVDESPQKNVTLTNAEKLEIQTAQLPINQYMVKAEGKYNYSKILAINQVFDILLTYHNSGDWREALTVGVPKRKGYLLK